MLAKMVLTNFKSFKNRTEVDFTKKNFSVLPQNIGPDDILKGGMFVGANASGKSNLLLAVKLLLDFLFKERDTNSGLFACLFSDDHKFSLEYYFIINGFNINYNVSIDSEKHFIEEKLCQNDTILLSRLGQGAMSYIADSKGISYTEDDVAKDTLFLRTLYFNTKFASNSVLVNWMSFLERSVYINPFDRVSMSYGKEKLDLNSYLQSDGCNEINKFFEAYSFEQQVEYTHTAKGTNYSITTGAKEDDKYIYFRRRGINEPIPFMEESYGNQNLLRLLPAFLTIINHGGLLLIDEFSSGFHNALEELLVKFFMKNSNDSQMLFVSHSTNLLSNSILRPDQEYAVEFHGLDGSSVTRFSLQQPRTAQNIEKMYNSGVFGGLPNYEEPSHED